ncbi:nicotinamidase-related amidase [Pedobacter cryoconitis]|uniref:Nicotinamidase-related amidase n=1 Tax=Pedobacter cryoconitis TaxID=188932 RepID=A0A7W8ZIM1_9SPHI|nr:isochorismatase family cysteine hydrolase [Pedobacter cryoconitis]MBB5634580.1 nicotinamidase-related amidase [Pedobacter cryoconitis]MBB6272290.1 nicotinamidase-related amidase [Pedobacter cryoconitis]
MEQKNQNTALLVMDMQNGISGMLPGPVITALTQHISGAITYARSKNMPVIYVTVGFRPGLPEISDNNKSFAAGKDRFSQLDMEEFTKIMPALAPQQGDVEVRKRRYSAFTGSDLEVVLRAAGIQHIVLTGVSTSGVMLSTLREAADKDYQITVLADCCADGDEEVHRVLLDKVFPRQADVLKAGEWAAGIQPSAS